MQFTLIKEKVPPNGTCPVCQLGLGNIGDYVGRPFEIHNNDYARMIHEGTDGTNSQCWVDGVKIPDSNGFWTMCPHIIMRVDALEDIDGRTISIESLTNKRKVAEKTMAKNIFTFEIRKEQANIFVKFKINPELEDFFRKLAEKEHGTGEGAIQTSARWKDKDSKGLRFYKASEELNSKMHTFVNEKYLGNGRYLRVSNDFGQGLYVDGDKINIALLRIAGAGSRKGVEINTTELLGYEEIKQYIQQLAEISKALYQHYIKKAHLKAVVTFEI